MEERVSKNEIIELEIEDIDEKARGIGYYKHRMPVYVYYAVPGDFIKARIVGKRRGYALAELVEVISKSERRVKPRCQHFGSCGGCKLQNLEYVQQLLLKRKFVKKAFNRYNLDVEVDKTAPSERIWYYRNRMDFVFGPKATLGLRPPERWDEVVNLTQCHLLSEDCGSILSSLRSFVEERGLRPFDTRTQDGLLRYLVVREGKFTAERLFNVVTYVGGLPGKEDLVKLFKSFRATSVYRSINPKPADTSYGESFERLFGNEYLSEKLEGYTFLIHPNSFFQTNSYQARLLISLAQKLPDFRTSDILLDLYSGTGLFSISLHSYVREVVGIEIEKTSVECARLNAKLNDVKNAMFLAEPVEKAIEKVNRVDIAIVDPPRAGMRPKAISALLDLLPREIVYFSCNPATAARDIAALSKRYEVEGKVVPIDMFPHTPHVEIAVKLVKR